MKDWYSTRATITERVIYSSSAAANAFSTREPAPFRGHTVIVRAAGMFLHDRRSTLELLGVANPPTGLGGHIMQNDPGQLHEGEPWCRYCGLPFSEWRPTRRCDSRPPAYGGATDG